MADTLVAARVSAQDKELAARAFGLAGYTASQAIQLLWNFAARNVEQPEVISRQLALLAGEDDAEAEKAQQMLAAAKEGAGIVAAFRKEAGTSQMYLEELDYKNLREEAFFEGYGKEL